MANLEGTQLGRYAVLQRIGSGGMGEVYLAQQLDLGRYVAVKVIHGESSVGVEQSAQQRAVEQFTREARAVAALDHPHILPVYDFGEQGGLHYLAMQYIPSGSLGDLDTSALPLPPLLVADLILQAGSALQYAHDHHVMHLDVKPQNLLIKLVPPSNAASSPQADQLSVLLADFGLARFITWASAPSGVAGTPLYTAPEQYAGAPTPGSDQYALAGVAFLLLTGRHVFTGTLPELYHQHLTVTPPLVSEVHPGLPTEASPVIARALAKDPQRRYVRIMDFAQALAAALRAPYAATLATRSASEVMDGLVEDFARRYPRIHATAPQGASLVAGAGAPYLPAAPLAGLPAAQTPALGSATPRQTLPSAPLPRQALPSLPLAPAPFAPPPFAAPAASPAFAPPGGVAGSASGQFSLPTIPSQTPAETSGSRQWTEPDGVPTPLRRRSILSQLPIQAPSAPAMSSGMSRRLALLALAVALAITIVVTVAVNVAQLTGQPSLPPLSASLASETLAITGSGSTTVSALPPLLPQMTQNQQNMLTGSVTFPTPPVDTRATPPPSVPALPTTPRSQSAQITDIGAELILQEQFPGEYGEEVTNVGVQNTSVASSADTLVAVINGGLIIRQSPQQVTRVSLPSLFAPILRSQDSLGEAKVIYDGEGKRWILVANELQLASGGVPNSPAVVQAGYFDVAISASASPSDAWHVYQFSAQLASLHGCNWADAPQVGLAAGGLFISGASFACGATTKDARHFGSSLWEAPLRSLYAGHTDTIYAWSGFTDSHGRPALSLAPAMESASDTTEWLLSDDAGYLTGNTISHTVALWAVKNTSAVESHTQPEALGVTLALPLSYADPEPFRERSSAFAFPVGDARITQATFAHGHLYAALSTAVNWEGDSETRTAALWLDIAPQLNEAGTIVRHTTITARITQSGVLGIAGAYVFYPILIADGSGNLALEAQTSSASQSIDVLYARQRSGDPLGSLGQGRPAAIFHRSYSPFTGGHWGDYIGAAFAPNAAGSPDAVWLSVPNDSPAFWATDFWRVTF